MTTTLYIIIVPPKRLTVRTKRRICKAVSALAFISGCILGGSGTWWGMVIGLALYGVSWMAGRKAGIM